MSTKWDRNKALDEIQSLAHAFQKSRVLFTALELELFKHLSLETPKNAKQIADELNADERALTRLLDALAALKLIQKKVEGYTNNPRYHSLLVAGEPDFVGDLLHISHLWEPWSRLTEIVKNGKPDVLETINEKDDVWIRDFTNSTLWKSKIHAEPIVNLIDLRRVKKVLDLACGAGHYTVEFLRQNPNLQPVVFDYPRVINLTHEHIREAGMEEKVEFLSGDVMTDDIGSGYDLVFISNLIHSYSIWDNVRILQRVFDALNRGGWVVINEVIIDDARTSPTHSALFSLNMLLNTASGDCYTETDIWIMLRESWFSSIKSIKTDFETTLMMGRK